MNEEADVTTLLAWVGADQRGPASIRIAADSRITWSLNGTVLRKWDYGRKVFASRTQPDMIGYCGDSFFPTQTISQVIDLIDSGAFFPSGTLPQQKVQLVVTALELAAHDYPAAEKRDFSILFGTRAGSGMKGVFSLYTVAFKAGKSERIIELNIPSQSQRLITLGSGSQKLEPYLQKWATSDIGGTSRSIFSSFCEFLHSSDDSQTGGPPQLVGLFRQGPGRSFGIVWDNKLYSMGMAMPPQSAQATFDCYNDLFELCDVITLRRIESAQRQPSPFTTTLG
jgi:hypothetical protein